MANTIRLRRGSGTPSAGSFVEGEPGWDSANGRLYVKAADGSMARVRGPFSKSITINNPTNSEVFILLFADQAITVGEIRSVLRGSSSPSVTFSVVYGTDVSVAGSGGTAVVTGGTTCTNTSSGLSTTTFDSAVIPAGNFVWVTTSAVNGIVNQFHASVFFL